MSSSNNDNVLKYNNNSRPSGYNNNGNYEASRSTAPSRNASTANIVVPMNMNLRSVEEIPEPYRAIFGKYHNFNVIQSKVFNDVFYTDEPLAVSAPTGSGKTVIFELAIVKLLLSLELSHFKRDYKIIYISPTKALCEERLVDWHRKFSNFDITCVSATGDSTNVDCSFLMNSNIIITTPEKWDSVTRSWRNYKKLVHAIKLFMIDEIHLLNEENRGPILEAVVSRMKTIQECVGGFQSKDLDVPDKIRFIAVSATIPNVDDIAEWLGITTKAAIHYKFHDDMRPVKLQKVVLGYPYNPSLSSFFKFDIMLCYKLHNILLQYAKGKPTLVFCSTRKSVELTAKHISLNFTINLNHEQRQILAGIARNVSDGKVRELLVHGVGYHHAGLLPDSRKAIESVFRDGNLPILVTTSTLAMGVNLPAHLVIIKSTKYYANGEYKDYSESTLYQMIGRAGRPQFDSSATAVIMTTASDKSKYENMVGGSQAIESRLHTHLVEHLNAEVVLRTITDLGVAMQWLTSTFLYIRARKNPKFYGLPQGLTPEQLDKKLLDMCHIEINKLSKAGMLTIDSNVLITPTITGTLMARNYLALETMKLFTQVTGKEQLQQILSLITKCHEYSEIYLRTTDKKALNLLNNCRGRDTIRFKLNGKIKTLDMKINCIIQAVLGCLEIMESSLIVEAQKIIRIAERVLNCLAEYLEGKPNCFSGLLNTLTLLKCCRARIWENSPFVSRQLHGIGVALSNALVAAEKMTFETILNANPRDIERIINRKPPTGDKIREQIKHLPKYKLVIKETTAGDEDVKAIDVTVSLENATDLNEAITVESEGVMNFLMGDDDNNIIVYEKYTHSYMMENLGISKSIQVDFKENRTISAFFISENWVGIDASASIVLFPVNQADEQRPSKSKPSKKNNKQSSSYMQHVLDTYFKKKKPISNGNDGKNSVKLVRQNKSENLVNSSKSPRENELEKTREEIGENTEVYKDSRTDSNTENDDTQHKNSENNIGNDGMTAFAEDVEKEVTENTDDDFASFVNEVSCAENKGKETQRNFNKNSEKLSENCPMNLVIEQNEAFKRKVAKSGTENTYEDFASFINEGFCVENKAEEAQSSCNRNMEKVSENCQKNVFVGKNAAFKNKAAASPQMNDKQVARSGTENTNDDVASFFKEGICAENKTKKTQSNFNRNVEKVSENSPMTFVTIEKNEAFKNKASASPQMNVKQLARSGAENTNEDFTSFFNEGLYSENRTKETQGNFNRNVEKVSGNCQMNFFVGKNNKTSAFSQVNVKELARSREKERQSLKIFEFEDILNNVDIPERNNLCQTDSARTDSLPQTDVLRTFQFSPKKQIHKETESDANVHSESSRKRKLEVDDDYELKSNNYSVQFKKRTEIKSIVKDAKSIENGAKSLTWSYPLVTSPAVKYSPMFECAKNTQNSSWNTSLNSSDTFKNTEQVNLNHEVRTANNVPIFPLSDKAWSEITTTENNSSNEAEMQIEDMVSLESLGFTDRKEETSAQLGSNDHKTTPLSQASSKLNQSKEINSGDYYHEKLRPTKTFSKFSHLKDSSKTEKLQNISNTTNLEKSKVDASVSTEPEFLDQQIIQAKPQKISVVGNSVSNYFSFVPFCEKNSEPENVNLFCASRNESQNKTNCAAQKTVFCTPEKEQTQNMFDRKYSWEKEFLENEFYEDDSDEQSLPESINLYRNANGDAVSTHLQSSIGNDSFGERQSYQDNQRLLRNDEKNRFYHNYYPEGNNPKPSLSCHDYINPIPKGLCNNNIQGVVSYDPQQNNEVKPSYFCTRSEGDGFYHHMPTMTESQNYFNADTNVDRRTTPQISQTVFQPNSGCHCCNNQTQSFAEQMRAMMHSRNFDHHPGIHQNFMSNHSYNHMLPQQNMVSNTGPRFNYTDYDDSVRVNYYLNHHPDAGIHPHLPSSYHPNQFERVPFPGQVADRSFLMDRYFHSQDLHDQSYLAPSRNANARFVNRNQPDFMRFDNV